MIGQRCGQRMICQSAGKTTHEVICMSYPNLDALLQGEPEAKQFFEHLPDYVREQICTRPQGVNSLASLKDYAENLTRGDD